MARGPVTAALVAMLALAGMATPLTALAQTIPEPSSEALTSTVLASSGTTDTLAVETTLAPAASAAATPAPTPVVPAAPAPKKAVKLTVKQIIAKVGRASGLSTSEVNGLLWIAYRESRYHPTSKSSSGCYGLFQLSAGMAKGHAWKDPYWNTKRAIKYMKGRYHGVLRAKSFWSAHHWY